MKTALIIVLAVVGGLVLLFALVSVVAGRRQRTLRETTRAEVLSLLGTSTPRRVDEQVNCFGLESKGVGQVRGTGCLAASDDQLVFALWYPRRTLRVARSAIRHVDTPTTHLGKTRGRPLLRIRFATEDGSEDAIAWWVRDLPAWQSELARTR